MNASRFALVVLPLAVLVLLAQSVLWIPAHDSPGSRNPTRLHTFVETTIGDARLLNPILMADTASARIVDLVFDSLLQIDDELKLRGSLASRWSVRERAYVLLADSLDASATAQELHAELTRRDAQLLAGPIVIHPQHTVQHELAANKGGAPLSVRVSVPRRLELPLRRVEPDLAEWIAESGFTLLSINARRERLETPTQRLSDIQVEKILPSLEHNPEITFWLRKDVLFHDGHGFDAGDVIFTYQSIMDSANRSPHRGNFEPVKSVQALDKHRVRVVYKRLFSPAVNVWTIGIVPEHLLNESAMRQEFKSQASLGDERTPTNMRDSRFNRNPIGTGPFQFKRWSSDELIHLTRNDRYRRESGDRAGDVPEHGPAIFNDYYFRIIPDTLTQEIEFLSGAADTYQVEPHQAARYRTDDKFRAFSTVSPGYTYIGYNQRKAPFDDLRVRKALGMAIDVDSIIRYSLFNEGARVTGPFASITQWYDESVAALPHDPEGARALLAQAGWTPDADGWLSKNGKRLEFNLITNNGNLRRKAIATIVQQAWRRIGVKCNVQLFEWAVFLKDFINTGQFDAVVLGWRLDLDPDLYQIWHSSQSGPNELNFVGFKDVRSDQLIEQLRREYDDEQQIRIAHELHQRIAELQPYTFLFAPKSTRLLDRRMVMRKADGTYEPVRAGGAGDLFYHMNRWQHLAHDPGF
ncbi:MAG: ABC-type transport system substrate-binding protein [Gammaproteobacteria bacterium]|jgi:ABC-type transport system substrate-binding protein